MEKKGYVSLCRIYKEKPFQYSNTNLSLGILFDLPFLVGIPVGVIDLDLGVKGRLLAGLLPPEAVGILLGDELPTVK